MPGDILMMVSRRNNKGGPPERLYINIHAIIMVEETFPVGGSKITLGDYPPGPLFVMETPEFIMQTIGCVPPATLRRRMEKRYAEAMIDKEALAASREDSHD